MDINISTWIKPPNIDGLICKVTQYHRSHSEMQIEVFNPQDKGVFYISFIAVAYFDGPMMWQGADFNVHDGKECLKILEKVGRKHSDDDTLFDCRIVNSSMTSAFVRIIAASSALVSEKNLFGSRA